MAVQVEQQLLKMEGANEAFRLWITAEPHPSFPIGLLHMGLKVTNEAPVGIKAGLKASYQWVSQVDYSHQEKLLCYPAMASSSLLCFGKDPLKLQLHPLK